MADGFDFKKKIDSLKENVMKNSSKYLAGCCVVLLVVLILVLLSNGGKKAPGAPTVEKKGAETSSENTVKHVVEVSHIKIEGDKFAIVGKDGNARYVEMKEPKGTSEDIAYIIGFNATTQVNEMIKEFFKRSEDEGLTDAEIGSFLQGLSDFNAGKTLEQEYMMKVSDDLQKIMDKENEKKKAKGEAYFASLVKDKKKFKTTKSGLIYETLEKSKSKEKVGDNKKVNVDYIMSVYDEKADNKMIQADMGNGVEFNIDGLIEGAREGIKLMSVGERARFYIKPELGYGSQAVSPVIGANSFLIFEIKLNSIVKEEPKTDEKLAEGTK